MVNVIGVLIILLSIFSQNYSAINEGKQNLGETNSLQRVCKCDIYLLGRDYRCADEKLYEQYIYDGQCHCKNSEGNDCSRKGVIYENDEWHCAEHMSEPHCKTEGCKNSANEEENFLDYANCRLCQSCWESGVCCLESLNDNNENCSEIGYCVHWNCGKFICEKHIKQ